MLGSWAPVWDSDGPFISYDPIILFRVAIVVLQETTNEVV